MQISVKGDLRNLSRRVNALQRKHIPKATALALTASAWEGRKAVQAAMPRVFDRPTRFTVGGVMVIPAKANHLASTVWLKGWAAKGGNAKTYLQPEIEGGPRKPKKYEILLRERGLLPSNMFTVPGRGAQLDAYGNISRGQLVRLLAAVGAMRDPYQRSKGKKAAVFFATPQAIWERKGKIAKPVLLFARQPQYKQRLDFHGIAKAAAVNAFPREFERAVARLTKR